MPTSQMLSASQHRGAILHDDYEFCTDDIGGYAVVLPKSSVWNASGTCDFTSANFPMLRRNRYNFHFFLNFPNRISSCARSATTEQLVASNFEIILFKAAVVTGPYPFD